MMLTLYIYVHCGRNGWRRYFAELLRFPYDKVIGEVQVPEAVKLTRLHDRHGRISHVRIVTAGIDMTMTVGDLVDCAITGRYGLRWRSVPAKVRQA